MICEDLRAQEGFSPIESTLATYFLEQGDALKGQSARSIAARHYTAPSTVSRLCKRLGFTGYTEFLTAYLDELRYLSSSFSSIDANQPFCRSDDPRTIAAKIGSLWRETVDDTLQLVSSESLNKAVELLYGADVTYFFSEGAQSHLAEDFVEKMCRISRRVIVPRKADLAYLYAAHARPDEAFIIASYSGETPNSTYVAQRVAASRVPLIAITSYGRSTISDLADVTLNVSTRERLVEKLGSYAMSISTMLLLDVLYSCVFACDYERNAIMRAQVSHQYERYRDSSNPILRDRRS